MCLDYWRQGAFKCFPVISVYFSRPFRRKHEQAAAYFAIFRDDSVEALVD